MRARQSRFSDGGLDLRPLIALLFVPGLYFCLLLTAAASLLVAGAIILLIGALGEHFHVIPTGLILALAIGGLFGVWISVRAGFSSVRRARLFSLALPIGESDAPRLFAMIRDLSESMGCSFPQHVIVELGTSFYVTEADVNTVRQPLKGRTLCLSAPLARILSHVELRSVLAHELAHFTGADTVFSRCFYPVYRGTATALAGYGGALDVDEENTGAAAAALPMILPMLILGWYMALFRRIESRIGRQRELRADAHAADRSSAPTIARALRKIHGAVPLWHSLYPSGIATLLKDGHAFVNLSSFFAARARKDHDVTAAMLALSGLAVTHPTDTHPSLSDRLLALNQPLESVDLPENECSEDLFKDLEALERELTDAATSLVQSRVR